MRSAPPLRIALAPDPVWRFFVSGLCIGTSVAVAVWWVSHGLSLGSWHWPVGPSALALAAWIGVAAGAWSFRLCPSSCFLAWDSTAWTLEIRDVTPNLTGTVTVSLDFDRWMLLRFAPTGRRSPLWLPVGRQSLAPQDWHALRCAVYSSGPSLPPVHDR